MSKADARYSDRPQVLIVDDSTSSRALIRAILSGLILDIEEAADGAEAFGRLLGRRFDLLITDLSMLPISGAQLVMAVQLFPSERRPGIIICSSDRGSSVSRWALQAASCFVPKPISAAELIASVTMLLPGVSGPAVAEDERRRMNCLD